MPIDVKAEVLIQRAREDVTSFAMNPDNDPVWISGIVEAKMLTDPPFGQGTQVARVAKFLGKRIEYVLEVVGYEPTSLMQMKSVKGPFPMEVSYRFEEAEEATLARIRVQGEATGFFKIASPIMARSVKKSITNDLRMLKQLLESETGRS